MSALPKSMTDSYEQAASPQKADLLRFPQNEIIRRRQYAAQLALWNAWKAEEDKKPARNTGLQQQPR